MFYFFTAIIKLSRPGGVKAMAAENVLLRQQLITLNRHQKRSPRLSMSLRFIYGILVLFIHPRRLLRIAIVIKPKTLLRFHRALVDKKYHLLFTRTSRNKPGPKGPSADLINIIIEMKNRNPRFGYLRIAAQIKHVFGIDIDKNIVKRVLDKHYKPEGKDDGPSWLTLLGHAKDSLWSIDFFRCESILLKSHWVMIVMDQFTRRIIGVVVHAGQLDGVSICRMFNRIISNKNLPSYLSSDHDPLFTFQRWQANLRILDIKEIKTIPYTPISHPFVERLIGTIRREYMDHLFFWNESDLERKLNQFKEYYNDARIHTSLDSVPSTKTENKIKHRQQAMDNYCWEKYCGGLFQLPMSA